MILIKKIKVVMNVTTFNSEVVTSVRTYLKMGNNLKSTPSW